MFERSLHVGWGDLDFNGHMKNTAFLDKSGDVRMMFFAENGFSMREFEARRFGPVVQKDELEYFRELRMLDPVRVTLLVAGMSADGSRFAICNEFFRADGKLAARVKSTGGWLDLENRRLVVPPGQLLAVMNTIARTADWAELPSSVRARPGVDDGGRV